MISDRIKFYADTPRGEVNKQFCFKTDLLTLEETIMRFIRKKFVIRAAWFEQINTATGERITSQRIPPETLQSIFDKVCMENSKKHHTK